MSKVIESAVNFMLEIANNNSHGYDQRYRWGEKGDYDCSSLIITAFEQAGVPLKTDGATYTGNIKPVALRNGFEDVIKSVNLATGKGLRPGDILLNEAHHVAMAVTNDGTTIVHASINENGTVTGGRPGDQTGREICTRSYYNKPWDCILRYVGEDASVTIVEFNATATVAVSDYLNVRSDPSVSAMKVGQFMDGDTVYINGKCNNGWYRCKIFDGSNAYVCGDYLENILESTEIQEYTDINDIVWELGYRGVVQDTEGMFAEMEADPNGRLYWLGRNLCHAIRLLNGKPETVSVSEYADINDIVWDLGHRGIVMEGLMTAMEKEPNGRLYWLARKGLDFLRRRD